MSLGPHPYYYNQQIRKYLIQFMAIFSGLQVSVGKSETEEERLITVPISYGNRDRIVASLLADNTQNKPLRLPTMSAFITGIDLAPEHRHGIDNIRRETYLPRAGVFPDDIKTVSQLMPVPYNFSVELGIYVSNTEQQFQILEQILMLFNPSLQIQTDDALFNWSKMTTVELTNIRSEENYPSGTDRRIIQKTLEFKFIAYISSPANVKDSYVKDIYARIGFMNDVIENAQNNEEIIAELDAQGISYQVLISADDAK